MAGILFENKIDHTTYFGTNIEYIQGIHMLPLLPQTPLVRTPEFVTEEWETYFSNGRAQTVAGGWRGILWGNYATIDPRGAYALFSAPGFDPAWLDGGASLTWYLCYAAGKWFFSLGFCVLCVGDCADGRVLKLWAGCERFGCLWVWFRYEEPLWAESTALGRYWVS